MIEDKVVLITGGTSGIGLACAKKFFKENYIVLIASVDTQEIVDKALRELNDNAHYYNLDVSNQEQCKQVIDEIIKKYKKIDVLCNIAGIVGELKPIYETNIENVKKVLSVDFMGSIYMAYYVGKYMAQRNKGIIINTSSISSSMATNHGVGYHSAKSAIDLATKMIAKDLAPYNVRCIAISPGSVETGLQPEDLKQQAAALLLKNRLIQPKEIANIFYLMSLDEASAINGTVIMADDGYCSMKI